MSNQYTSLENFTAAVSRLGQLREDGLVRIKAAPGRNGVVLAIDPAAQNLPEKGGGLYADIMDVLSAIAEDRTLEDFIRTRSLPGPDFDEGEGEAISRAKYEAALAAFPHDSLRGGISGRARVAIRRWVTFWVITLARRFGYLGRMMAWYGFRRVLGPQGRRLAWNALGARIAESAWIGARVTLLNPRHVTVGAGSKLGGRIAIESHGEVSIGRNVLMNDTDLFAAQHDVDDPGFKAVRRTISIGDYAWLPHKIIILPGVSIGSHAVVGTGSVVSRDVPDYGIAVGNPARVVKERARIKYTYTPADVYRPALVQNGTRKRFSGARQKTPEYRPEAT